MSVPGKPSGPRTRATLATSVAVAVGLLVFTDELVSALHRVKSCSMTTTSVTSNQKTPPGNPTLVSDEGG